jgi:Mrp family chromosome partitioning ATPase
VDGDLRRPALHLRFALPNQAGLTTLLTTPGLAVEGLLQPVGERLRVLTAGPPTEPAPWPPERLAGTVRDLARAADLVLVDGPSLADGAEAAMLAAQADGVLLVAAAGRTRVPALTAAVDLLAFAGARVHGVVLNRW